MIVALGIAWRPIGALTLVSSLVAISRHCVRSADLVGEHYATPLRSSSYDGGNGIDAPRIAGEREFTRFSENTASIEMLDLRNGASIAATLNAEDILAFGGSTGEIVNGSNVDLVVRGDTGAGADTVNLQHSGSDHFTLQASGIALSDPAYGGSGTLYDLYSDGAHQVAVEQGVTAST